MNSAPTWSKAEMILSGKILEIANSRESDRDSLLHHAGHRVHSRQLRALHRTIGCTAASARVRLFLVDQVVALGKVVVANSGSRIFATSVQCVRPGM